MDHADAYACAYACTWPADCGEGRVAWPGCSGAAVTGRDLGFEWPTGGCRQTRSIMSRPKKDQEALSAGIDAVGSNLEKTSGEGECTEHKSAARIIHRGCATR